MHRNKVASVSCLTCIRCWGIKTKLTTLCLIAEMGGEKKRSHNCWLSCHRLSLPIQVLSSFTPHPASRCGSEGGSPGSADASGVRRAQPVNTIRSGGWDTVAEGYGGRLSQNHVSPVLSASAGTSHLIYTRRDEETGLWEEERR